MQQSRACWTQDCVWKHRMAACVPLITEQDQSRGRVGTLLSRGPEGAACHATKPSSCRRQHCPRRPHTEATHPHICPAIRASRESHVCLCLSSLLTPPGTPSACMGLCSSTLHAEPTVIRSGCEAEPLGWGLRKHGSLGLTPDKPLRGLIPLIPQPHDQHELRGHRSLQIIPCYTWAAHGLSSETENPNSYPQTCHSGQGCPQRP